MHAGHDDEVVAQVPDAGQVVQGEGGERAGHAVADALRVGGVGVGVGWGGVGGGVRGEVEG